MNAPTTIRVTQKHIDAGVPREGESCPIALALKELWDEPVTGIEVLMEGAVVYVPGGWYSADTWPQEAANFVECFDWEDDVTPVEFAVTWHFQPDPDGVS